MYKNERGEGWQVSRQHILPPKYIIQIIGKLAMASRIILDNITFINNPAPFLDNLQLEITFTALQPLSLPLDWKIIYVGSAKDEDFDQTLQEFQIGPIKEQSTMKFTVDCGCPDYTKIPADELICVTALIITINYRAQEFIRVGYYVHNVLDQTLDEQQQSMPSQTLIKNTTRTILTDKPRITTFKIAWDEQPEQQEQSHSNKINTDNVLNSPDSLQKKAESKQEIKEPQQKHSTQQKECDPQPSAKKEVENCELQPPAKQTQ